MVPGQRTPVRRRADREWIGIKGKLHRSEHKPPFVSERDLWRSSLGQNVGSEVNGKGDRFSRPVLIMRKLAHGFYLVAPTTTREGEVTWCVQRRIEARGGFEAIVQIVGRQSVPLDRLRVAIGDLDRESSADGKTRRFDGGEWTRPLRLVACAVG